MSKARTTKERMLAWAVEAYGEPIQLMKIPVPETEPHDVLIRMHGAEVGDWDDLVRKGGWPMGRPFPLVLGLAGAGTVAAVGQAATGFVEGDPVWIYNYPMRHDGCRSPDHNSTGRSTCSCRIRTSLLHRFAQLAPGGGNTDRRTDRT